ncbi:MAG: fibronectin type III domain-containing protein [Candidatus Shapirobacteria bacterium]
MPRYKLVGLSAMIGGSLGFLGLLGVLVGQPTRLGVTASIGATPREIKLTNLSANSLTVSWVTDEAVTGTIKLGTDSFPDDRGAALITRLHHVTLENLRPNQTYAFEILSQGQKFANQDQPYIFNTAQVAAAAPPAPFYLRGQANGEALVYFAFNDSLPISTLTDSEGRFLLTLSNALEKNRQDYYPLQEGEKGYLLFQTNQGSETQEVVVQEVLTLVQGEQSQSFESSASLSNLPPSAVDGSASSADEDIDRPRFNLLAWLRGLFGQ